MTLRNTLHTHQLSPKYIFIAHFYSWPVKKGQKVVKGMGDKSRENTVTYHNTLYTFMCTVKDCYYIHLRIVTISTFLGQMAFASLVIISGPKKVSIFRAHPFQWPSKWIFPRQNHYVPRHITNRYINSYIHFSAVCLKFSGFCPWTLESKNSSYEHVLSSKCSFLSSE